MSKEMSTIFRSRDEFTDFCRGEGKGFFSEGEQDFAEVCLLIGGILTDNDSFAIVKAINERNAKVIEEQLDFMSGWREEADTILAKARIKDQYQRGGSASHYHSYSLLTAIWPPFILSVWIR